MARLRSRRWSPPEWIAHSAKTGRAQLRRVLDQLDAGDVVTAVRLDRLAQSGSRNSSSGEAIDDS
jgi:DNA invertase Pin-like site-specific DNA recombinase